MKRSTLAVIAVVVLVLLASCTVGPDYHKPDMAMPAQYGAATQPATTRPASQAAATQPAMPPVDLQRWWESFNDPMLSRLVNRAVQANLDVRLATARIREARASLAVSRSAYFPTVDANGSYSRNKYSQNGISGLTPTAHTYDVYQAGFDANWEIDVFGGTRRGVEAAQDTLEARIEARRQALVTLLGDVAQNYIALRGYQNELAVVRRNEGVQKDTLDVQQTRFEGGIATSLDLAQASSQVSVTQAQIPTLQTNIQQAIHSLSILLDQPPAALTAELSPDKPLPIRPPSIPVGLPSELLRRRPDVRNAERLLAAANANIGVATAELFPKFYLTGMGGLQSISLRTFADASSAFWSVGPSVTWRIFDGGAIRGTIHVNEAQQEEAFIQYRQAVLQSLEDVENALVAYDHEQTRRASLAKAVEVDRQAVDLSQQLHDAGVVDFLNVLTAEKTQYQDEDSLAQSNQSVATDLVALYKALGGGWEATEPKVAEK